MSSSSWLALLFDGPLQSWGFSSRFTRRTTALHPTKSGVVGLLAAALGIDKHGANEIEKLAPLAGLNCITASLPKERHGTEIPVRRLLDYHTVGGGYDPRRDRMKIPRKASGASPDTSLSERHYLLDARFGVLLEGGEELIREIACALENPCWGIWLGRKNCIPSTPVFVTLESTREAAFRAILKRCSLGVENTGLENFDHVIEGPDASQPDAEWIHDLPISFGASLGQRHAPRRILSRRRK
jgi:CRISPR system Cascade subunit CasD